MSGSRIAAIAVKTEEHTVRRVFTDEERDALRRAHFSKLVELAKMEEAFEVLKMKHKEDTAPVTREVKTMFIDIRNGFRDETIECYLVDDQERGVMEYYDKDGVKVDERRLYPEERQTRAVFAETGAQQL